MPLASESMQNKAHSLSNIQRLFVEICAKGLRRLFLDCFPLSVLVACISRAPNSGSVSPPSSPSDSVTSTGSFFLPASHSRLSKNVKQAFATPNPAYIQKMARYASTSVHPSKDW